MAKAHEIAIAADTKAFDQGIRDGIIKPLDKAEEALEDLGDAAADVGRDGTRGVEKLEAALKDAQRQAKRLGDDADDAGGKIKKGMERAEDGVQEFKDEANQTAKEAAASFDGSAESIADVFQEIAANAFAGFGPAGAAAGLLAAAGIGFAVSGFDKMNEAEQESRKRAAEWADAYVDAGGRILSASQIVEKARSIITDAEQYQQAQSNARDWGVTESTALLAMAGDTNALAEARDSLAQKERDVSAALEQAGGNMRNLNHDQRTMREEASAGRDTLAQLTGEMDRGAQGADIYSQSLSLLAQHTAGAKREVDQFGDSVVTLPDGKVIYIDAETGKATDNVSAIERQIYGVPTEHNTTFTAEAYTGQAQRDLDNWIAANDGRSIRVYSRVTVDAGSDFN